MSKATHTHSLIQYVNKWKSNKSTVAGCTVARETAKRAFLFDWDSYSFSDPTLRVCVSVCLFQLFRPNNRMLAERKALFHLSLVPSPSWECSTVQYYSPARFLFSFFFLFFFDSRPKRTMAKWLHNSTHKEKLRLTSRERESGELYKSTVSRSFDNRSVSGSDDNR